MLQPWESVLCAATAHINVDECGAPERFLGCKLVPLAAPDGKLRPEAVRAAATAVAVDHAAHHVQPRVVSISQSTEYGTVYRPDEIRALSTVARELGLLLHMDGARLANAAAALDLPLRALTADVGVDVLSFGGTKNGALAAEAVVFFDPARDAAVRFGRKQAMQLPSKMRFMAAQFEALLRDGLWRRNALHANRMARRLAEGAATVPGVTITQPVDANAVFAVLPRERIAALQERRAFLVWDRAAGRGALDVLVRHHRAGRGLLRRGHARSPRLTPGRKARSIWFQSSFTHVGARCTSPSPCLAEEECSCAPS